MKRIETRADREARVRCRLMRRMIKRGAHTPEAAAAIDEMTDDEVRAFADEVIQAYDRGERVVELKSAEGTVFIGKPN